MKEMREKMEQMTSPVATKSKVQMKTPSGTRKPEEQKRTGQSTFYKVYNIWKLVLWKVT